MPKVLVTGGSGKLGRAVLRDLVAHGYDVLNIDQQALPEPICPSVRIDLTSFGEVAAAIMGGVDERKGPLTPWCTWRRFRRRGLPPTPAPSPTMCP
jgi:nucleoside-diphosphate-sugar epimerase